MSASDAPLVIAEFRDADDLCAAARNVRMRGFDPLDALTPCPVEGLDDILRLEDLPIRWPMLIAALGVAALGLCVEFWTAVYRLSDRLGRTAPQQLAHLPARAVRSRRARCRGRGLCGAAGSLRPAAPSSPLVRLRRHRARDGRPLFPPGSARLRRAESDSLMVLLFAARAVRIEEQP